jgi:hypothetical protein
MYIKKLTLNVFWSNGRNFFLNTNKGLEIRGSIGGLEIDLPYYVPHIWNFLLRRGFGGQVEGLKGRVGKS